MINTKSVSTEQNLPVSLIQKVFQTIIAGVILVVTVSVGAIAGLIGFLVRAQLPDTQELESAPLKDLSPSKTKK